MERALHEYTQDVGSNGLAQRQTSTGTGLSVTTFCA
jgi:hypothetical protein